MKKTRGPVKYTELQKNEIMEEIQGYPDYYITNFGRLLSLKRLGNISGTNFKPPRLREVTLSYGSEKYFYANIYNEYGIRMSLRVHRLVYQYFNPKKEGLKEGYVIDHIDHNKLNNHIDNLRQITWSENSLHFQKYKRACNK